MHKLILAILMTLSSAAFSATVTFECNYTSYSDDSGKHKVEGEFKITFLVDEEAGKSYIIGNNGSNEVILLQNPLGSFSFIEITDTRNVMTTTITSSGESVHSRNSVVFTDLVASQYYGQCASK